MLSLDCARQPSSVLPLTPPVMGRDGRSTLQCRANAGPERASKGEVRLCRCNARHAVPRPPSAMGQPWPQGRVAEGATVGTLVQRGGGGEGTCLLSTRARIARHLSPHAARRAAVERLVAAGERPRLELRVHDVGRT